MRTNFELKKIKENIFSNSELENSYRNNYLKNK